MRWPLQPLQPFQQTQLQPPFGQSVDSLCHPWFTTTNVSYRFPILKLPPPPCAVLLVIIIIYDKSARECASAPRCFYLHLQSHVAQRYCVRLKAPSDRKDAAAVDHVIPSEKGHPCLRFRFITLPMGGCSKPFIIQAWLVLQLAAKGHGALVHRRIPIPVHGF